MISELLGLHIPAEKYFPIIYNLILEEETKTGF
jgi:hypothetical protein